MPTTDIVKHAKSVVWSVLDKFERMEATLQLEFLLPKTDFLALLGQVWVNVDNGEQYWPQVVSVLKRASPLMRRALMEPDDLAAFDALPDNLVIYRGESANSVDFEEIKPAWSLDREVAQKFAYTEDPMNPAILQATVEKKDIYAHFVTRGEQEILFDSATAPSFWITDVELLPGKSARYARDAAFYKAIQREGLYSAVGRPESGYVHAMQGRKHFADYLNHRWSEVSKLEYFGLYEWAEVRRNTLLALEIDPQVPELLQFGEVQAARESSSSAAS